MGGKDGKMMANGVRSKMISLSTYVFLGSEKQTKFSRTSFQLAHGINFGLCIVFI